MAENSNDVQERSGTTGGGYAADPMAEEDLEAIEERLDAAAPGPWRQDEIPYDIWIAGDLAINVFREPGAAETAKFVANSRKDIEALLAEVRRLRCNPKDRKQAA